MSRSTIAGLVLALVMAVGAAPAAAHEFEASNTGELMGEGTSALTIKTSGGTIECTKSSVTGTIEALKTESLILLLHASSCTLFGLIGASASPIELLVGANGAVKILKEFTVSGAGCTVTFPPQILSGASYTTNSSDITAILNVTGLTSSGSGLCAYSSSSNGTLQGSLLILRSGGTLGWK